MARRLLRPVLLRILPYRSKSEVQGSVRVSAVAGIWTDITRQKRAQEGTRRAPEQRDRFLATLSHELRHPLAAIQGATQLLHRTQCSHATVSKAGFNDHLTKPLNLEALWKTLNKVSRASSGCP